MTIRFFSRKSFVIGVPGYGVGCWMYGQSTYCLREREVGLDRLARVAGIADDQAADDEQAVPMQDVHGVGRGVADAAAALPLARSSRAP